MDISTSQLIRIAYLTVTFSCGFYGALRGLRNNLKKFEAENNKVKLFLYILFGVVIILSPIWVPFSLLLYSILACLSASDAIKKFITSKREDFSAWYKYRARKLSSHGYQKPPGKPLPVLNPDLNSRIHDLLAAGNWEEILRIGPPAVYAVINIAKNARENHRGYYMASRDDERPEYDHKNETLIKGCVNVLGKAGSADAMRFLIEFSKSWSKDYVFDALKHYHNKEVVAHLEKMIADARGHDVVIMAKTALGHIQVGNLKMSNDDLFGHAKTGQICAGCRQAVGEPYKFFYSMKLHESKKGNAVSRTYTRPISNYVSVCNACLAKGRIRFFFMGLAMILPLAGYLRYSHEFKETQGLLFLAGVVACLGLFAFIIPALRPDEKSQIGANVAMRLAKPLLRKQGYDKFWDTNPWKDGKLRD